MRGAVDAVCGAGDHGDPVRSELGRQFRGDVLTVRGRGARSDESDRHRRRERARIAPHPEAEGRVKAQRVETPRPEPVGRCEGQCPGTSPGLGRVAGAGQTRCPPSRAVVQIDLADFLGEVAAPA